MTILENRPAAITSSSEPRLDTRDWTKWNLAHPYIHKGWQHHITADQYNAALKAGFKGWVEKSQSHFDALVDKHGFGVKNSDTHLAVYNEAASRSYAEAVHSGMTAQQMKWASTNKGTALAKKAKLNQDHMSHAEHLGAAHGWAQAAVEQKAIEKANGLGAVPSISKPPKVIPTDDINKPGNPYPAGSDEAHLWNMGYIASKDGQIRHAPPGMSAAYMKVWYKGWDGHNANAPVPEDTETPLEANGIKLPKDFAQTTWVNSKTGAGMNFGSASGWLNPFGNPSQSSSMKQSTPLTFGQAWNKVTMEPGWRKQDSTVIPKEPEIPQKPGVPWPVGTDNNKAYNAGYAAHEAGQSRVYPDSVGYGLKDVWEEGWDTSANGVERNKPGNPYLVGSDKAHTYNLGSIASEAGMIRNAPPGMMASMKAIWYIGWDYHNGNTGSLAQTGIEQAKDLAGTDLVNANGEKMNFGSQSGWHHPLGVDLATGKNKEAAPLTFYQAFKKLQIESGWRVEPKTLPAAPLVLAQVSLENHAGTHNKFYESAVTDNHDGTWTHHTAYGSTKPGMKVTQNHKHFTSVGEAFAAHEKITTQKQNQHGYEVADFNAEHINAKLATTVAENIVSPPPTKKAVPTHSSLPVAEADLAVLKKISGPLGSNGGQWYELPDGGKILVKPGASPDHIYNEVAVNSVYRVAGANVKETAALSGGKKVVGRSIDPLTAITPANITPQDQKNARQHFGIDALTSNWDVFGLPSDPDGRNLFRGEDGQVYRLDNGGGGFYRAMGSPKGADFEAGDWDAKVKAQAASTNDYNTVLKSEQGKITYGNAKITDAEIVASLNDAADLDLTAVGKDMEKNGVPSAFVAKFLGVLQARQKHLRDMGYGTNHAGDKPDDAFAQAAHHNGMKAGQAMLALGSSPKEVHEKADEGEIGQPSTQIPYSKGMHEAATAIEQDIAFKNALAKFDDPGFVHGMTSDQASDSAADWKEMIANGDVANTAQALGHLQGFQELQQKLDKKSFDDLNEALAPSPTKVHPSTPLHKAGTGAEVVGGYEIGNNFANQPYLSGDVQIHGPSGSTNIQMNGTDTVGQAIAKHEEQLAMQAHNDAEIHKEGYKEGQAKAKSMESDHIASEIHAAADKVSTSSIHGKGYALGMHDYANVMAKGKPSTAKNVQIGDHADFTKPTGEKVSGLVEDKFDTSTGKSTLLTVNGEDHLIPSDHPVKVGADENSLAKSSNGERPGFIKAKRLKVGDVYSFLSTGTKAQVTSITPNIWGLDFDVHFKSLGDGSVGTSVISPNSLVYFHHGSDSLTTGPNDKSGLITSDSFGHYMGGYDIKTVGTTTSAGTTFHHVSVSKSGGPNTAQKVPDGTTINKLIELHDAQIGTKYDQPSGNDPSLPLEQATPGDYPGGYQLGVPSYINNGVQASLIDPQGNWINHLVTPGTTVNEIIEKHKAAVASNPSFYVQPGDAAPTATVGGKTKAKVMLKNIHPSDIVLTSNGKYMKVTSVTKAPLDGHVIHGGLLDSNGKHTGQKAEFTVLPTVKVTRLTPNHPVVQGHIANPGIGTPGTTTHDGINLNGLGSLGSLVDEMNAKNQAGSTPHDVFAESVTPDQAFAATNLLKAAEGEPHSGGYITMTPQDAMKQVGVNLSNDNPVIDSTTYVDIHNKLVALSKESAFSSDQHKSLTDHLMVANAAGFDFNAQNDSTATIWNENFKKAETNPDVNGDAYEHALSQLEDFQTAQKVELSKPNPNSMDIATLEAKISGIKWAMKIHGLNYPSDRTNSPGNASPTVYSKPKTVTADQLKVGDLYLPKGLASPEASINGPYKILEANPGMGGQIAFKAQGKDGNITQFNFEPSTALNLWGHDDSGPSPLAAPAAKPAPALPKKTTTSVMWKNIKVGDIIINKLGLYVKVGHLSPNGKVIYGHQVQPDGTHLDTHSLLEMYLDTPETKVRKLTASHPVHKAFEAKRSADKKAADTSAMSKPTTGTTSNTGNVYIGPLKMTHEQAQTLYDKMHDDLNVAGNPKNMLGYYLDDNSLIDQYNQKWDELDDWTAEGGHTDKEKAVHDELAKVLGISPGSTPPAKVLDMSLYPSTSGYVGSGTDVILPPQAEVTHPQFLTSAEQSAYQTEFDSTVATLFKGESGVTIEQDQAKHGKGGSGSTMNKHVQGAMAQAQGFLADAAASGNMLEQAKWTGRVTALKSFGGVEVQPGEKMVKNLKKGSTIAPGVKVISKTNKAGGGTSYGNNIKTMTITSPEGTSTQDYNDHFPVSELYKEHLKLVGWNIAPAKATPPPPGDTALDDERFGEDKYYHSFSTDHESFVQGYKAGKSAGAGKSEASLDSEIAKHETAYITAQAGTHEEGYALGLASGTKQAKIDNSKNGPNLNPSPGATGTKKASDVQVGDIIHASVPKEPYGAGSLGSEADPVKVISANMDYDTSPPSVELKGQSISGEGYTSTLYIEPDAMVTVHGGTTPAPTGTVIPSSSAPKKGAKTHTSVMAKNLKSGDQILLDGQHVTLINKPGKISSGGSILYYHEDDSAEEKVKALEATNKITKLAPGHPQFVGSGAIASSSTPNALKTSAPPADFEEAFNQAYKLRNWDVNETMPQRVTQTDAELQEMPAYKVAFRAASSHGKEMSPEEAEQLHLESLDLQSKALSSSAQAAALGASDGYLHAHAPAPSSNPDEIEEAVNLDEMPEYHTSLSAAQNEASLGVTSKDLYAVAGKLALKPDNVSQAQAAAYQLVAEKVDLAENAVPQPDIHEASPALTDEQLAYMKEKATAGQGLPISNPSSLHLWAYDQGRAQGLMIGNIALSGGLNAADIEHGALSEEALANSTVGLESAKHWGAARMLHRVAVQASEGSAEITSNTNVLTAKPDVKYYPPGSVSAPGAKLFGNATEEADYTGDEIKSFHMFTGPYRFSTTHANPKKGGGDNPNWSTSDNFYCALNTIMAGMTPAPADPIKKNGTYYAEVFLNACNTKSVPSEMLIYRGTQGGEWKHGELEQIKAQVAAGHPQQFSLPISSCTYNPDVGIYSHKPIHYFIDQGALTMNGTFKNGAGEGETNTGGLMEIYKIQKMGSKTVIYMRQVVHYAN